MVLSHDDYLALTRPSDALPFHEIQDADERARALESLMDEVLSEASDASIGLYSRGDLY